MVALPAIDVEAWVGGVSERQVRTGRPSYINAILIQSRGSLNITPCEACTATLRRPVGPRPFTECRSLPGFCGGCCGNCKWRDYGAQCSSYDINSQPIAAAAGVLEGEDRIVELEDNEE